MISCLIRTKDELSVLVGSLGGDSIAGSKLKENGAFLWKMDYGTNLSGFSGRPGALRTDNGSYWQDGYNAFFWSSTQANPLFATCISLYYNVSCMYWGGESLNNGLSVRCLRN